ncbi:MAG: alpha-amylase family glycosyl hydrolase [Chloroflexota bacterium]
MDFVFGTLATDELRQLHHRVARLGVQHEYQITPADPQPGQPVTLTVRVGQDILASHVAAYYTTDDTAPVGSRGQATSGAVIRLERVNLEWDSIAWGYVGIWQGIIPPQPDGTIVRYQISAWSEDAPSAPEAYADYPALKATTERAAAAFFRGEPVPDLPPAGSTEPTTFNYHVDTFQTPDWAQEAVIYHVFVDRFHPGNGHDWLEPEDVTGFYGGTLWGVRDRIDYIADLGATCIWLSPTFCSPTHHGYDITDYYHVEPRLGGDDALHALVEAAHARGIRVLLDLVCNHCSDQHPYFIDARQNPNSPYRTWFTFDDSPVGYETFFGVASMPVINVDDPGARAWMLDVAQYWLREFDVDGYRLDHANGAGPGFWSDFRAACRAVKPDCLTFGEVVEAPNLLRTYTGRLDGLLDFMAEDMLRKCYAYKTVDDATFQHFLQRHYAYFPADFIMPTFLDNHDMDRFLFIARGDKDALKRAARTQFTLPGPPIIYYGTEVGLSQQAGKYVGRGLEESRLPMPWGVDQDTDLLAFYKDLIRQRRSR